MRSTAPGGYTMPEPDGGTVSEQISNERRTTRAHRHPAKRLITDLLRWSDHEDPRTSSAGWDRNVGDGWAVDADDIIRFSAGPIAQSIEQQERAIGATRTFCRPTRYSPVVGSGYAAAACPDAHHAA